MVEGFYEHNSYIYNRYTIKSNPYCDIIWEKDEGGGAKGLKRLQGGFCGEVCELI